MNGAQQGQERAAELAYCGELPDIKYDHLAELGFERLTRLPLKLDKSGHYLVRATADRVDIFETTKGISQFKIPENACLEPPVIDISEVRIKVNPFHGFKLLVLHITPGEDVCNAVSAEDVREAADKRAATVNAAVQRAAASAGATKISRE